ncbi:MAG: SpaA isopeptide-forming pilin-related protein [Erysipelotrichaceae bacterium]|uniref:isopeptide-forming domain-containing fimbrial protein n=1 Tax=Floccifex sp. TaxID=2815810 RepID=UPI002A75333A|nr:SpaA isopeptide-forming pilin-related protein [Floccifex sp.]MDD7281477.1 SpaA isopeptide-forming pilin-related protein [Erysipelotrichaceae bacterium]MDY2957728.1 SpaA isopeptide-forming pilin-related protein [Floccifex sp.]
MNNKKIFKMFAISTMALASFTTISALSPSITLYAQENTVTTQNGVANFNQGQASIVIKPNKNQSLVSKQFRLYKLFDAKVTSNSVNYSFNETYKQALQNVVGSKLSKEASKVSEYEVIDYIQTMTDNSNELRLFVEELRDEIVSLNLDGTLINVVDTQSDGSIRFEGLAQGYYLTDEVTNVQNQHSAASLIMLETASQSATIQIKSDYPTITKKIKEDDNNIGWNDIADFEIGQNVPYKYETYVPDIMAYKSYKMAFHDIMDEALTFDASSVKITISDASKSYTLTSKEMNISENVNNESFEVTIDDIKEIVDREFTSGVYGQTVTLTYQATLNDKASTRTGRAGFENKVRLEFSNNPDSDGSGSTGLTPWDTVVCFTFKMNGLKIDDENIKLEGAKFRLYRDENCTNEVYLKQGEGQYIVMNTDHVDSTKAVEMISNKEGVFNISGLDQGTYYLKETQAPDGYRQLKDPIKIEITPEYCTNRNEYIENQGSSDQVLKNLSANATIKQFYNGPYSESEDSLQTNAQHGSFNLSVVNQEGSSLPITGSNTVIFMLLAGCGLMILSMKNRKQNEE